MNNTLTDRCVNKPNLTHALHRASSFRLYPPPPIGTEGSTSVFSDVKNAISTRQTAELYGFAVNRNGMMCCPFHGDKHPSMKVDSRFHCFACQANRSCNLLYRQTLLIEVLRRHLSLFFPTLCMTFCIAFISQVFHHFTHFAHSLRIFLQIPGLFGKDLKIHIIGTGAVEVVHQLANVRVIPIFTVYIQD